MDTGKPSEYFDEKYPATAYGSDALDDVWPTVPWGDIRPGTSDKHDVGPEALDQPTQSELQ